MQFLSRESHLKGLLCFHIPPPSPRSCRCQNHVVLISKQEHQKNDVSEFKCNAKKSIPELALSRKKNSPRTSSSNRKNPVNIGEGLLRGSSLFFLLSFR